LLRPLKYFQNGGQGLPVLGAYSRKNPRQQTYELIILGCPFSDYSRFVQVLIQRLCNQLLHLDIPQQCLFLQALPVFFRSPKSDLHFFLCHISPLVVFHSYVIVMSSFPIDDISIYRYAGLVRHQDTKTSRKPAQKDDLVRFTLRLPRPLYRQTKRLLIEQDSDSTLTSFVVEAISEKLGVSSRHASANHGRRPER
jgi:hypothetical protein